MMKVGFTREQAEEQAEAINEIISNDLATKQDILMLKRDIKELKLFNKLTLVMGAMFIAAIGILDLLLKK
jgi:acid phosphatase family membrane protein YuiD